MTSTTNKMITLLFILIISFTLTACECSQSTSECCTAGPNSSQRFFEMRTYHCNPGKLDALNARFRDHTNQLFIKHGMQLVGYWSPTREQDGKDATLVYILAYPSEAARNASWEAFRNDPVWQKAYTDSTKDGKLIHKVDSIFLSPTDYSPIK